MAAQLNYDGYIIKFKKSVSRNFLNKLDSSAFRKLRIKNSHLYKFNGDYPQSFISTFSDKIEYAEPDYFYYLDSVPSDPLFNKQWGLRNKGGHLSRNPRGDDIWGKDINILRSWNRTLGAPFLTIAVMDTGIDYNHPDIKENMWINISELYGKEGVDDDRNGYIDDIHGYDFALNKPDMTDDWNHGTHVAGIIGAVHNNIGIAGILAQVKLMGLKIFNKNAEGDARSPSSAILEAIDYCIKEKVNIINASWGGGDYSKSLEDALKKAGKKGIIFVTTAGNKNVNIDEKPYYPASYNSENIIVVGSHSGDGHKSVFSGYGKKTVDIFAPGENIISLSIKKGEEYGYWFASGTSMAAPHVTGTIGMALSLTPLINATEIKRYLHQTAKDKNLLAEFTMSGRLDSYYFLKSILPF